MAYGKQRRKAVAMCDLAIETENVNGQKDGSAGEGDSPKDLVRDDICPRCGSDDLDGDFVSRGGDSAVQEMYCRNCDETWENHYSFDRMDFPVTGAIVHVQTEMEKTLKAEIKRLEAELAAAKGHLQRVRQGIEPAAIERYDSEGRLMTAMNDFEIDQCPYCGTRSIDEDERGEIFDESGYFRYKCYGCKRTWTLAGTIDRVIEDEATAE